MLDVPEGARQDAKIAEMLRAEAAGEWPVFRAPQLIELAWRLLALGDREAALPVLQAAVTEARAAQRRGLLRRRTGSADAGGSDPTVADVLASCSMAKVLAELGRPEDGLGALSQAGVERATLDRQLRGFLHDAQAYCYELQGRPAAAEKALVESIAEVQPARDSITAATLDARRSNMQLLLGVAGNHVYRLDRAFNLLWSTGDAAAAWDWLPSVTTARLAAGDDEQTCRWVESLHAWSVDHDRHAADVDAALVLVALSNALRGTAIDARELVERAYAVEIPGTSWSRRFRATSFGISLLHCAGLPWLSPRRAAFELMGLERWCPVARDPATAQRVVDLLRLLVDLEQADEAPERAQRRLQRRAYLSVLEGDPHTALGLLSAAAHAAGSTVNVRHDIALVHRMVGQSEDAAQVLQEALGSAASESAYVRAGLGHELASLLGELGHARDAQRLYERAMNDHLAWELDLDAADARANLAALAGKSTPAGFEPFRSGGFVMAWSA